MKILHTADWHLGHRLHEQSQYEEQTLFLQWLENHIKTNEIDILLVSGDVFDTGVPSTQSQKMYYDFLIKLTQTNCKHIVITGGNHDAPGTINAPKELLNALSIKVVGKSTERIEDEVFTLKVEDETVIVAAVPYLRDQDIRKAVAGETFDQIEDRYKTALVNHYTQAAEHCATLKNNTPVIAMGHLFATGGSISDSEQNIYVGNLGHIGAKDFPPIFDYVALGHLHKPQLVGGSEHIRYCGSPVILSFSEIAYEKRVIVLHTENNTITQREEVEIPKFREILRVSGTIEECTASLQEVKSNAYELTPWVEVVIDSSSNTKIGFSEIQKAAEPLDLKVLKVTLKKERKTTGIEQIMQGARDIKELKPIEVFEMKCKEQGFDIENSKDIRDAFNEAVQIAQEN